MDYLTHDGLGLLALVFSLGMKHGFDADHLATINGLTRYNGGANPGLAPYCGTLFSLGHGAVVVAVAVATSLMMADAGRVPGWMQDFGALVSIAFLTLLGCANLQASLVTPLGEMVAPVGVKGRLLGRLQQAGRPILIALVGALFALSFDTLSQAVLFALDAARPGDYRQAAGLGLVFMLGMLATDGLNGIWLWRLLRRADRTARIASRVMGLTVGGLSLALAGLGLAKYLSPQIGAGMAGHELGIGLALAGIVSLSFAAALMLARAVGRQAA